MILVFEFSDMLCHQQVLRQNRFSPLFELVSDSIKDDTLMLNWDNSMGSGKAED